MNKGILKRIGFECMLLRMKLHWTQREVAEDLHCSPSSISRFESGNNDSATILMWYMRHGLEWRDL